MIKKKKRTPRNKLFFLGVKPHEYGIYLLAKCLHQLAAILETNPEPITNYNLNKFRKVESLKKRIKKRYEKNRLINRSHGRRIRW